MFAGSVDQNDNLHRAVEITQTENHLSRVDQRTCRNHHRFIEDFMTHVIERRLFITHFDYLTACRL